MLEEKLVSILEVLEKSVETVAGVASKELPLLAQELLTFKTIWHWFIVIIFSLLFLLLMFIVLSRDDPDTDMLVFTFTLLTPALFSGYYLVMIYVAPRLYLLGQIKGLIR